MKSIFESKTFWLNVLSGLAAFLEGQQFIDVIPAAWHSYAAMVVFGINIVLRYITTQPVAPLLGDTGPRGPAMIVLLLIPALTVSTACGKKPAVLIGQAGVITVDSIYEVHKAVIALNLPADKERPIQVALLRANGALAPVPDLIIAIDNATKAGERATTEIDKAYAYLLEGAKYLDSINGDLKAVPAAASILVLVGKVQTSIATVLRAIEQIKAPVPSAQRVERTEVIAALKVLYGSPLAAN